MKRKKKTILFILSLILFFLIFVSWAFNEEKNKYLHKYPPYPDMWGYEFSTDGTSPSFRVAKALDGDYTIIFINKRVGEKVTDYRYGRTSFLFFGGSSKDLKHSEYNDILDKIFKEKSEVILLQRIIFKDESILEVQSMGGGKCADPFDMFLRKRDKDGKVIEEKMLLYLCDKPIKKGINKMCERNWQYKGEYYFEKVENMFVKFFHFEDDTFLMLTSSAKSVLVIRFDKDLNTKTNLMNRKVFLIDRKTFKEIRNKMPETNDQVLNDSLSYYLTSITKKEVEK